MGSLIKEINRIIVTLNTRLQKYTNELYSLPENPSPQDITRLQADAEALFTTAGTDAFKDARLRTKYLILQRKLRQLQEKQDS